MQLTKVPTNTWQMLSAEQSPTGAFKSTISGDIGPCLDWNGFMTALVIRTLGRVPINAQPIDSIQLGLKFLYQCESSTYPGAFGFWPPGQNNPRVASLPEDADDTAVIALELAKWGYLTCKDLVNIACKALIPHRLHYRKQLSPSWIRSGVFLTWLRQTDVANVIDCCVNANVVALLAYANLHHLPGYREACEMIEAGIRWAGNDLKRAKTLTPFYPHPVELTEAVQHAVTCGAKELIPSLTHLQSFPWALPQTSQMLTLERPICSSAYGSTLWRCEVLQRVRQHVYEHYCDS